MAGPFSEFFGGGEIVLLLQLLFPHSLFASIPKWKVINCRPLDTETETDNESLAPRKSMPPPPAGNSSCPLVCPISCSLSLLSNCCPPTTGNALNIIWPPFPAIQRFLLLLIFCYVIASLSRLLSNARASKRGWKAEGIGRLSAAEVESERRKNERKKSGKMREITILLARVLWYFVELCMILSCCFDV